jgi:hypothetical protein
MMTRQTSVVEINKFVGGLVTDASPLTFPENTSFVDVNMELKTDGSRKRALGVDYENGFAEVTTSIPNATINPIAHSVYRWENVGGNAEQVFIVVQFGNEIKFFDASATVLSATVLETKLLTTASTTQKFSFASVDGNLTIATGVKEITTVKYDGTFTYITDTIKVRDFFGVEDVDGADDLTVGTNLQKRPTSLSQAHMYNLRNQSFGITRIASNTESNMDPAYHMKTYLGVYPSNSDTVGAYLYADATDADDRNVKRFFAKDLYTNPLGTNRAAQGYFIIDLLNRGASRIAEDAKNRSIYPALNGAVTILPTDYTAGGATVVAEFAGRVWYGGFSGEVTGGDSKSPKLSSYVAFSQLVTDPSQVTQCYQSGDPTSDTAPDLIDTDGGVIRLSNAYGIRAMVNLGKTLIILAANGVWRVFGGNDSGFSATNYSVEKITDKGCIGSGSVVTIDASLMYWSEDGIYLVNQNQFGDWVATSATQNKIQTFYDAISTLDKQNVVGSFDSYQRKVRWLYGNRLNSISQQKELVLDTNLSAFYERHISQVSGNTVPVLVGSFRSVPFRVDQFDDVVTVDASTVTVGAATVTSTVTVATDTTSTFNVMYVAVTAVSPYIKYTFASYSNTSFVDWFSFNGVGVDAPAVLVTGEATGGDTTRNKAVPYLFVHLRRTEDGFSGDFVPTNQSSCIVQAQWDWTDSANSKRWGTPFETYRYARPYFPVDINDPFDTGDKMINTRNKLRGHGKSLALKFYSSPGKEMHIYGWSFMLGVTGSV